MAYCELTGSVVGYDGQTLQPGSILKVFKAISSVGSIIASDEESYTLKNDGTWAPLLRFERASLVYLHLNAPGFDRDEVHGTPLQIPDTATALLASVPAPEGFPDTVPVAVADLDATVARTNAENVFSTVQTIGDQDDLIDSLAIGADEPQRLAITHGSAGSPTTSMDTTVSIQRFDGSDAGPSSTVATLYVGVRKTGGSTFLTTPILGLAESISEEEVHDIVGVAGFAGSGLNGAPDSTGRAFGLYGDATLWNVVAQANGGELDVRNHSGAEAPLITTVMPAGATVGLALVGKKFGAGSEKISVQLIFQNGDTPARTGIHFDTECIDEDAIGIEFNYLTQGTPIRFRNDDNGLVARNAADDADRSLIKFNAANQVLIGDDGDRAVFGAAIRPGVDAFVADTAQIYRTATQGLVIAAGVGSSYDFLLANADGDTLLRNPTGTKDLQVGPQGNVVLGGNNGAIITSATDGFVYLPTMAGVPSGAPTVYTGYSPVVIDTTNSKIYARIGGAWKSATLT